jgi:hypothetical protein
MFYKTGLEGGCNGKKKREGEEKESVTNWTVRVIKLKRK